MKIPRIWLRMTAFAVLILGVMGCTGGTKDEEQAFQELRAKPMTDDQKAMLEKVKGGAPAPSSHAGATNG